MLLSIKFCWDPSRHGSFDWKNASNRYLLTYPLNEMCRVGSSLLCELTLPFSLIDLVKILLLMYWWFLSLCYHLFIYLAMLVVMEIRVGMLLVVLNLETIFWPLSARGWAKVGIFMYTQSQYNNLVMKFY